MWPLRSGSCQHRNSHAVHFAPCTSVCQCRECKFQCSVVPGGQLFFAQGAADREPADSMSGALFFFSNQGSKVCVFGFSSNFFQNCVNGRNCYKKSSIRVSFGVESHMFFGVLAAGNFLNMSPGQEFKSNLGL